LVTSIGGLVRPTLTSLITQATPREEQGVVLGLTQSLNSLALIIAPPLGGYLIEQGWLTVWGLTASAVAFIGLMLASGARNQLRENSPPVNATVP
jgi:MFS family permease